MRGSEDHALDDEASVSDTGRRAADQLFRLLESKPSTELKGRYLRFWYEDRLLPAEQHYTSEVQNARELQLDRPKGLSEGREVQRDRLFQLWRDAVSAEESLRVHLESEQRDLRESETKAARALVRTGLFFTFESNESKSESSDSLREFGISKRFSTEFAPYVSGLSGEYRLRSLESTEEPVGMAEVSALYKLPYYFLPDTRDDYSDRRESDDAAVSKLPPLELPILKRKSAVIIQALFSVVLGTAFTLKGTASSVIDLRGWTPAQLWAAGALGASGILVLGTLSFAVLSVIRSVILMVLIPLGEAQARRKLEAFSSDNENEKPKSLPELMGEYGLSLLLVLQFFWISPFAHAFGNEAMSALIIAGCVPWFVYCGAEAVARGRVAFTNTWLAGKLAREFKNSYSLERGPRHREGLDEAMSVLHRCISVRDEIALGWRDLSVASARSAEALSNLTAFDAALALDAANPEPPLPVRLAYNEYMAARSKFDRLWDGRDDVQVWEDKQIQPSVDEVASAEKAIETSRGVLSVRWPWVHLSTGIILGSTLAVTSQRVQASLAAAACWSTAAVVLWLAQKAVKSNAWWARLAFYLAAFLASYELIGVLDAMMRGTVHGR